MSFDDVNLTHFFFYKIKGVFSCTTLEINGYTNTYNFWGCIDLFHEKKLIHYFRHKIVFASDKISLLNFCISNRITKTSDDMWLPQMKRFKQDAPTQDVDGMQALPVWEYIPTLICFMAGRIGSKPPTPTLTLRFRPCNMQHFETKTDWYLASLAPCDVYLISSHTLSVLVAPIYRIDLHVIVNVLLFSF